MDNLSDNLSLNFFDFTLQDFEIPIYRKLEINYKKINDPNKALYNLPNHETSNKYSSYLVSIYEKEGFERSLILSKANFNFTNWYIFEKIKDKVINNLDDEKFILDNSGFYKKRIFSILSQDYFGKGTVWFEPFFLKSRELFGILCRYRFLASKDVDYSAHYKDILIRSLSLKQNGKRNIDYYADQFNKIKLFLDSSLDTLFPITIGDVNIDINRQLLPLKQDHLKIKTYEFNKSAKKNSQFLGIKEIGPYQKIPCDPLLFFVFREKERNLSYDLHDALAGKKFSTFSGLENMFGIRMNKETIRGKSITDYQESTIKKMLIDIKRESEDKKPIIILLIPDTLDNIIYYKIKYLFLKEKIASQFVEFNTIASNYSLKWAISNIGLGIFAKLGGIPWKIHETGESGLIIGMGQSHYHNPETKQIERYFAYSILTDTSGTSQKLHVLSRTNNRNDYLSELKDNLTNLLRQELVSYDRFAIHTPFNFKYRDMDALFKAVDSNTQGGKSKFAILRFDDRSKFIAFDKNNNSLTPYESSFVQLSNKDYLVWFEGLQYHNPNINTQISLPMHISFEYPNILPIDQQKIFLQEALNLSGANWRGFNAKTSPISFYYSRLVAKYVNFFDQLGYIDFHIEDLPLWFL